MEVNEGHHLREQVHRESPQSFFHLLHILARSAVLCQDADDMLPRTLFFSRVQRKCVV